MIENNKSLFEIFGSKIFRVPDYQRGYAWDTDQLSDLWEDLEELILGKDGKYKPHYTGTIFLKEISSLPDEKWCQAKFYDVIDGQQRLTTISILLHELLMASPEGYSDTSKDDLLKKYVAIPNKTKQSKVYIFSYSREPKNPNYEFLLHKIFEDKTEILPSDYQNCYTKNLENAKNFFIEKINSLSQEDKEILFNKLTTSLIFDIRIIESDFLDEQVVFETMNNRGKSLSTLEKLKNRLIYLTAKMQSPTEDTMRLRSNINNAWKKIYIYLAKNPEQILHEDTFLSAHLSLYEIPENLTFSEKESEKKVFQMFCNKAMIGDCDFYKKINNYILDISELAPTWYEIHNSESELINKILIMNSRKEIKIFLASIIQKLGKQKQDDILSKVEKIFFRNRLPNIWFWQEDYIADWARKFYKNEMTIDDLVGKLNNLINIPINKSHLIYGFKRLFDYERKNKGFHRWENLKYFLFEYEVFLKNEFKERIDRVPLSNYNDTTIEHIIPQAFETYWSNEVNEVTNALKNKDNIDLTKKVLINTLGNLTILRGGKNKELQNKSWEIKKERFEKGSYNEFEISHNEKWNKSTIKQRGLKILKFLESKLCDLKFTDTEKMQILFYDDNIIEAIEQR